MNSTDKSPVKPNQCLSYRAAGHAQSLLQQLCMLHSEKTFCDATIIVGSQIFTAHCVVLSACSQYFKVMFCGGLLESLSKQVELHGVEAAVFDKLLEFIYTGEIDITSENVQDLLSAADMLQIPEIIQACCNFLRSHLHPANCLGIYKFASARSCIELCAACDVYTHMHFLQVIQHDEFIELECTELLALLSSEKLRIENELQVFKAGLKWILHDATQRKKCLVQILDRVRFPIISCEELFDYIETHCTNLNIKVALGALLAEYNPKRRFRKSSNRPPTYKMKPRLSARKYLYVIGGYNREPGGCWSNNQTLESVDRLDSFNRVWNSKPKLNHPRSSHTVETLDGVIYAIGGEDDLLLYDSVEAFDPLEEKWVMKSPMTVPRSGHCSCVFEGAIYVFGGCIGTEIGQTIEYYCPKRQKWRESGKMLSPRTSFGLIESEGLIYLFGGMTAVGAELRTAESYNPITKETASLADMRSRRIGCSAVVIDDNIFVVGGSNARKGALNTVEQYSIINEKWTTLPCMSTARTGARTATVNGLLYVVGGRTVNRGFGSAVTFLDTVECYDPRTQCWTNLDKMSVARCEAAIAVL
ncbi:actin-binding protein IPP-like [Antedon mediterranea]|uniref:actin-binding protein IPP-like n=1 Tax=Antedon mediterranea TaxID=105859 RepID=UPI003AF97A08